MPTQHPHLPLTSTLSTLPPENTTTPRSHILTLLTPSTPKLVILDDDPTGTQTCHDIAVLTTFETPSLQSELLRPAPGFFILTNTRAMSPAATTTLLRNILSNLRTAAEAADVKFTIVLRGDSTLRGHFPLECDVVDEVFGASDAWIVAPFFLQGGRYTLEGVHYVAERDVMVPVGETAFARDATFGFAASEVREWVREKAPGRFEAEGMVVSLGVREIREGGVERVVEVLRGVPRGGVVVVDSCAESDMDIVAAGVLHAESQGSKLLFRTAAAFVSSRLGIIPQPPLSAHAAGLSTTPGSPGALIVAGSYVPKTTVQLSSLITSRGPHLKVLELSVNMLLSSPAAELLSRTAEAASVAIAAGQDVLIMTSRELIKGGDADSSLEIGGVVAAALVDVVRRVTTRPRYIVAKGGITSSDMATKALGMRRAMVLGQAAPGVPLWRCDEETCLYSGVPYVVFPGNVGGDDALAKLVEGWAVQAEV
ncbi:hypothetical protein P167DRAFT_513856 [Morchella conica CCBAS932]|uniref:Ketose-bisphosphate aldolase class-II family protein n=1 Tax=Morchella conica CCBAS932 TaxID=1392247 RepID=A0A3N4KFQ3_9PEZI|nr:hypothetical protein P167DRAFT_513856 [Morchella conica CCBAS932]